VELFDASLQSFNLESASNALSGSLDGEIPCSLVPQTKSPGAGLEFSFGNFVPLSEFPEDLAMPFCQWDINGEFGGPILSTEGQSGKTWDALVGGEIAQDPLAAELPSTPGQAVVFVDASVPDYQALLAEVPASTEIVVIQPDQDGIAKVAETLAFYDELATIHLITHGESGEIRLGSAVLNADTLPQYADQIQGWKQALTADADILLYGCEVAAGREGEAFIDQLSHLTGADIAASDDLTGHAELGGDWQFEASTGTIEAGLVVGNGAIATYGHTLADIDFSSQKAAIRAGLVDLQNFANTLDNTLDTASDFAKALPLVGQDLGSVVDLSDLVQIELIDAFDRYADGTPTTGELAAFIAAETGWTVNDLSDANEIEFQVILNDTTSNAKAIDLSKSATGVDFNLEGSGTFNTQVALDFNFGFTIGSNSFFTAFNSFNTTGSFTADLDGTKGRLGFVEFEVAANAGNELELNAGLSTTINGGNRLTTANLQATDLTGLFDITPTGNLTGTLPVNVTLNGFAPVTLPEISLSYASAQDIFSSLITDGVSEFEGVAPAITFSDSLADFTNITADDALGMLRRVVDWFDRLRQANGTEQASNPGSFLLFNDIELPFVGDLTLGDVLDFGKVLESQLITPLTTPILDSQGNPVFALDSQGNPLLDDNGNPIPVLEPAFTTVQDFAEQLSSLLPGVTINALYNPGQKNLTFDLEVSPTFDPIDLPLNFDLDLAPLGNLSTNATVQIAPTGSFDFTLGFDLSPLGNGVTFDGTTALSSLNNGTGILVNAAGVSDLSITLRDNTNFEVDLSSLTTLGDVKSAIETASGGNVTVTIDATQRRLVLQDSSTPVVNGVFKVTQINSSLAAAGLGILGSDSVGEQPGIIEGLTLISLSLSQRVFLDDASVTAGITLNTPGGVSATADFGFLGIAINDGSANINANVAIDLLQPNNPTSLADLYAALTKEEIDLSTLIGTPTINSFANLALQNITVNDNFLGALPAVPSIALSLPDLTDLSTLDLQFANFDPLNSFRDLDFSDIVSYFRSTVNFLQELSSDSTSGPLVLLNEELPLIDRSVNDLLNYADQFAAFVQELESDPAQSVQAVEVLLEEALGLTPDSPLVDLSIDGDALRIDLDFVSGLSESFGLEMKLAELAQLAGVSLPSEITDLIGVSSAAELDVEVEAILNLALGIDLSTPTSPRAFLYDGDVNAGGTGLALNFQAVGSNLDFTAQFGPIGIGVEDGTAFIGDSDDSPATFSIGLGSSPEGRRYLDGDLAALANSVDIALSDAIANATLPLKLPAPFTTTNLALSITDLQSLLDGTIDGTQISLDLPNFQDLLTLPDFGLIGLLRDPGTLVDGLDTLLATVQNLLNGEIFGTTLPLVGDSLAPAGQFIEGFREAVLAEVSNQIERAGGDVIEAVRVALFNVFGTGPDAAIGLNLLRDKNSNGVDIDDIEILGGEAGDDFVQFAMRLGSDLLDVNTPIGFELGLPVLGFDLDAEVNTKLGWNFDFSFGVSQSQGFFFDTSKEDELEVSVDISLQNPDNPGAPAKATGNLAFLQIEAEDKTGDDKSGFGGRFVIDLKDPGQGDKADNRFTFSELLAFPSFSSIFEAGLKGLGKADLPGAQLNMGLELSFGGSANFPRMLTDFELDWGFDINNFKDSSPTIAFRDVRLDAGSFLSDFAKPIFGEIKPVLDVVGPVVDFLDTRLPLVSDLLGETITLIDLAETFKLLDTKTINTARQFISAVKTIRALVDLVASVPDDSSVVISFGDFEVGAGKTGDSSLNLNLRNTSSSQLSSAFNQASFAAFDPASNLSSSGGNSTSNSTVTSKTQSFLTTTKNAPNGGIQFPLLSDPASAIGLLFGQDADLFFYDMPQFDFTFPYEQEFRVLGVIKFTLGGSLGAAFDYDFGYDTSGLRKFLDSNYFADVFDGFFFADLDSNGFDKPETVLRARLFAEGGIDIGLAGGGVGGGLTGTANFNLNDPNDDGKVRISEIFQFIDKGDYECIFDIDGNVVLDFYAFVEAFFGAARKDFPIADFELITFDFSCVPEPILATEVSDGILRLNTGRFAKERIYEDITDGNENFTVTQSGDTITVSTRLNGKDFSQDFTGITKIFAEGGQGNDTLDLSGVQVVTELSGGIGQDVLRGGAAQDTIRGGDGDDDIFGNGGADFLFGEQGQDEIAGGAGDDYLSGGGSNDTLSGDQGSDSLEGGLGNDQLAGGADNDTYLFVSDWGQDTTNEGDTEGIEDTWQFSDFTVTLDALRNALKETRIDFSDVNLGLQEVTTDLNIRLELGSTKATSLSNRVQHNGNNVERILGGRGDDIYEVFATGANLTILDGLRGDDDYIITAGPNLGDIRIRDTGPAYNRDRLIIEGTSAADTIGLTSTQVTIGNPVTSTITYDTGGNDSGLEILLFNLKGGDDILNVDSTPETISVTANGEGDNDTFNVGIGGTPTVNNINGVDFRGPLVINGDDGEDILNVDDSGDTTDNTGNLTDNLITGLGMAVGIRYETLEDLNIRLGTGSDTFTVEGTHGGTTTIDGNAGEEAIIVESVSGATTINGDGDNDTITIKAQDLPINPILVVNGQTGNDQIDASLATLALVLNGDDDDDTIQGGAGNDLIGGGAGNDAIDGNSGNDEIYGDSSFPDEATDPAYAGFSFPGDATENPPSTRPTATQQPLQGNDTLQGGNDEDTIYGEGGNDDIIGGSTEADADDGRDYLYGGEGNDAIAGDNATIDATTRQITTLDATSGEADIILGDGGEVVITDGNTETLLTARPGISNGNDTIAGGIGDDVLLGDNGKVTLNPSAQFLQVETTNSGIGGDDAIAGNEGRDRILAGAGNDTATGDAGADLILGDEGQIIYTDSAITPELQQVTSQNFTTGGSDTLHGGDDNDIVLGGANDDEVSGDGGNDILLGDNGQINYTSSQVQQITTLAPTEGGSDTITGGNGTDIALGGASADQISGDAGEDILLGDNGQLDYSADGDLSTLDTIRTTNPGIGGNDQIEGNDDDDILLGGAASDQLMGNGGNDIALGDNGEISLVDNQIDQITTTDPTIGGNDAIAGNAGQDIILGGAAGDDLQGNENRDIILGDNGVLDFTFDGDARVSADTDRSTLDYVATTDPTVGGQDLIQGGLGDDYILGGTDSDTVYGDGSLNVTDPNWQLVDLADFNQDGQADTLWRNRQTGQLVIQLIQSNNQVVTTSLNVPLLSQDWTLAGLGDLNGDGNIDLIWRDQTGRTVGWFLNGLSLAGGGEITNLLGNDWQLAGVGDLNGDGKADLVWRNLSSGQTFAWFMDGTGPIGGGAINVQVGLEWQLAGVGDLNGDGRADLLWQLAATGDTTAWFMDGLSPIGGGALSFSPGTAWQLAGVGDLNGDGKGDLLWRNLNDTQIVNWLMDGQAVIGGGSFLPANPLASDFTLATGTWQLQGTTALEQSGQVGLVWRNTVNGELRLTPLDNGLTIAPAQLGTPELFQIQLGDLNWQIQSTDDFNSDGQGDLLWRDQATGQTVLWLMNNLTAIAGGALSLSPDPSWQLSGTGDITGDGKPDLIWRNQFSGEVVYWEIDGTQVVAGGPIGLNPGLGWQLQNLGDFNGDGKADFLWRNLANGDTVAWFMNGAEVTGGGSINTAALDLAWTMAATGDYNQDGHTDITWQNTDGTSLIWFMDGLNHIGTLALSQNTDHDLILGDQGSLYRALPVEANYFSTFSDQASAGAGDTIYGDGGTDKILGQQGADTINGGSGEDDIIGGHNVIGGLDSGDVIAGDTEADVILGDNGTIQRRPGDNGPWQRYAAPKADIIRDVVRFDDVEAVNGLAQTVGNDTVDGGDGDDIIHGQRGQDSLLGGADDDELYGELGRDTLQGGAGHDTMLGDVGIISRAYNTDGTPRLDAAGNWHRDVILTDVATAFSTLNLNNALAEAALDADALLLTGSSGTGGFTPAIQQLDLVEADNDVLIGDGGNDQMFGQRGNDTLNGSDGNDYLEGNAGNDSVQGGNGDDTIIGDNSRNLASFNTENPIVQRGYHLIDTGAESALTLDPFGNVVIPQLEIEPDLTQGLLPALGLSPELPRTASPIPVLGNLTGANNAAVTVLASIIPDLAGHLDVLAGNDTLSGDAGLDTIIGDHATQVTPLRTGNAALDLELDRLVRDLQQLGIGLHDLELQRDYHQQSIAQPLLLGRDFISGGPENDLIVGDNQFIQGPFRVETPNADGDLSNLVSQLRQAISSFSGAALALQNSLTVASTNYIPHTFNIGGDNINGDGGDDSVVGDDHYLLTPILSTLPYVRDSFWDYGFGDQQSSRTQSLRDYDRNLGNDTINGGDNNDFLNGDYAVTLVPIINTVPQTPEQALILEQSLDQLIVDIKAFLRDLNNDAYGIDFNQVNYANSLQAGNDAIDGASGNDLMVGDNSTRILPFIAGSLDLAIPIQNSKFDLEVADHNLSHSLPRQFEYLFRPEGVGVTVLGEDQLFGGEGNDVMFGLRAIDTLFGQDGNDYLFGGDEADILEGGLGTNVVRTGNPSRQDETDIAVDVTAKLAAFLSPDVLATIQEIIATQGDQQLAGKLTGRVVN
jgi:Ca2+-binding RTX toxin-like protein